MKKLLLALTFLLLPVSAGAYPNLNQAGDGITVLNDPNVGTTLNTLTSLTTNSPVKAVVTPLSATSGVVGITVAGAGTTNAALIQTSGLTNCTFDGSTTAGDYFAPSSITAGYCHDVGSAPTSASLGQIISTSSTSPITVLLNSIGTGSSSSSATSCLGTVTFSSGTATFSSTCVDTNSYCSCRDTTDNSATCYVGNPSSGSVVLTGNDSDGAQVSCTTTGGTIPNVPGLASYVGPINISGSSPAGVDVINNVALTASNLTALGAINMTGNRTDGSDQIGHVNVNGAINPVTYGADPTGVADSTSAIASAYTAAVGKEMDIPSGTYKISGAGLSFTSDNTIVKCSGHTVFSYSGNANAVTVSGLNSSVSGCNVTGTASATAGYKITNLNHGLVENAIVMDISAGKAFWFYTDVGAGIYYSKFRLLKAGQSGHPNQYGFYIADNAGTQRVNGDFFDTDTAIFNTSDNWYISDVTQSTWLDLDAEQAGGYGINLQALVTNDTFIGAYLELNTTADANISGGVTNLFLNCRQSSSVSDFSHLTGANLFGNTNNVFCGGVYMGAPTFKQLTINQPATSTTDAMYVGSAGATSNFPFSVRADGQLTWGPGSGARDTTLSRSGINTLNTPGSLLVGTSGSNQPLTVNGAVTSNRSATSTVSFGSMVTGDAHNRLTYTLGTGLQMGSGADFPQTVIDEQERIHFPAGLSTSGGVGCTGSTAPWFCCTGAGTGTCTLASAVSSRGAEACVVDDSACTGGTNYTAGGGTTQCLETSNGTNWKESGAQCFP